MKRRFSNPVVVGVVIVAAGCTASPTEDTELRTSSVAYGQVETGYPAVGCLGPGTCSGTLIAPNLVLSAKHCGAKTQFNLGSVCGNEGDPGVTHFRTIDYAIQYVPDEGSVLFTDPDAYPNDLAVYHLTMPIYDVRPLQVNPGGIPANGTNCVAVGFGRDTNGVSGTKRSATVTVSWSGELIYGYEGLGYTLLESAIEVQPGPAGSSPPSGIPRPGDSGSPLLCNGSGVIRGVFAGHFFYPDFVDEYYTALDNGAQNFNSSWVTSVASNYVNEPMISATRWGTNHFDVFMRGMDGAIYHKTFDNGTWSPSVSTWTYLGGFITGTPEAVSWGPDRIDVFMRGGDPNPQTNTFNSMSLHHLYWNGSSWNWQQLSSGGLASHPVAVSWGVNRLDVFALASNGYIYQWSSNNGTSWGYGAIPTDTGPVTFLPTMKAFSTSSGSLDLYAVGTDSMAYHNHYNSAGVWSGWTSLGGPVMGTPAVASWGGDRQDIFFKSTGTELLTKVFLGGAFLPSQEGWWSHGGPVDGSPALASMKYEWLTLVSNGASGLVYQGYFGGSQWAPTNYTWSGMGGIKNGANTLLAIPDPNNTRVNLFSMDGAYQPGVRFRTLNADWGGNTPLGGVGSW